MNRNVNDENIETVIKMIKEHCPNITGLQLFSNHLTSKGVTKLFDNIADLKNLNSIDVSGNDYDDDCFSSVANFIENSPSTQLALTFDGYDNVSWGWEEEDIEYFRESGKGIHVTDKAVEILHRVLIGNTTVQQIILSRRFGITEASVPLLKEIAQQSAAYIDLTWTSIPEHNFNELEELFALPIEQREIPISSISKSASKIQM